MSRRTPIAIVILLFVTVAGTAAAAYMWTTRGDGSGRGPLVLPPELKMSIGLPVKQNAAYSYSGPFIVRNDSDRTVVLDQAGLVRPGPGIAYLGAYAMRPRKGRTMIGAGKGYLGGPLAGVEVAPHALVQIVFGVKLTKPGSYSFRAVALRYHVGNSSYADTYPYSGRLCAPIAKYLHSCLGLLDSTREGGSAAPFPPLT